MVIFRSDFLPGLSAGIPLLLLVGCATREVPTRYPESSPASPAAGAAAPLAVTRALDEEPPLPGSEGTDWKGLRDGTPQVPSHEAHEHHGGHSHGQP